MTLGMFIKAAARTLLCTFIATHALAALASKRVLLSGFEPFGWRSENSSQVAIESLIAKLDAHPDPTIPAEIEKIILPVAYDVASQELIQKMESYRPDIVISFGELPVKEIHLETTARNFDNTLSPDANWAFHWFHPIVEGGPDQLPTLLPVREFKNDLEAAGIPAVLSESAGSYVCNNVFYHTLHAVSVEPDFQNIQAGFVHLPVTSVGDDPGYPQRYARAIQLMLRRLFKDL